MREASVSSDLRDIDPEFADYLAYCERQKAADLGDVDEDDIW